MQESQYQRLSYSQFGEDLVIEAILETHGRIANGVYVDIGAFHPWHYSNTALLHQKHGWRGINIDPNKDTIDAFGLSRPQDSNLVALVGSDNTPREYVRFDHPAVNSCDPHMLSRQLDTSSPFREVGREMIAPRRLDDLLDAMPHVSTIDFMNIDVEGMDLEVLQSNDWARWRPFLIAVEAHGLDLERWHLSPLHQYLVDKDYRFVSHVFVTSIFIRLGS